MPGCRSDARPALFTVAAGAATCLASAAPRRPLIPLAISSFALILLPVSCAISVAGYPGGDDRGSLHWTFFVGATCMAATLAGAITVMAGLYVKS